MKRTISKLLGLAALAIIGSGLFVPPASAAPLRTSTNGGITCGEYLRSNSTWPNKYWDCITPDTNQSAAINAANGANSLPVAVQNVLIGEKATVFLFASNADYVAFTGAAATTGFFGAIRGPVPLPQLGDMVKMAVIYKTVTIAGTPTVMQTNWYGANMKQQLARIYGPLAPANLKPTDPFFTAAIQDDFLALSNNTGVDKPDYPSSQTVWGAAIAATYPGKSPWEILGLRYNATYYDKTYLYGLQTGRQGSLATEAALNTFLQSYMRTTREWASQQVYAVNPQQYQVVNNVLCVQTNGVNTFPLTWWSCVRPYTPSVAHQAVKSSSNTLPAFWQTLLKDTGVRVYAMRNIDAFVNFFGGAGAGSVGVLGNSISGATPRSAAFADTFTSYNAGPPIVYSYDNAPTFMSGTILHELGHQFDKTIWANISTANSLTVPGSILWQTALAADKAAFNALPCGIALDVDRAAASLPLICGTKPAGTSNFDWLGTAGLVGSTTNQELWARAFQRRAGGTQPAYAVSVQIRLGANMHAFMNDLWTTGVPHN